MENSLPGRKFKWAMKPVTVQTRADLLSTITTNTMTFEIQATHFLTTLHTHS